MSCTRLLIAASLACVLATPASAEETTPVPAAEASGGVAEATVPGTPEAHPGVLLETIRSNRKAMVAVNLALGPEEAARFWPLYERYQGELDAIGDRVARILEDYIASFRDLSDEKALQLMEAYLAAETERVKVRSAYLPEFAKVLAGRTAVRFYQIENKMDAVLRYDLAATIPVVEEGSEAPAAEEKREAPAE